MYRDDKLVQSTQLLHYSTPVFGKLWSMDQIWLTTVLGKKLLLELSHLISLYIVYGCFHSAKAELGSCNRICEAWKPQIFTTQPYKEKVG